MTDNTERSVAEVGVTQADRDRAADYAERHIRMLGLADRYRSGVFDDDLVQAFARHRTEAEARVGEVEEIADAMESVVLGGASEKRIFIRELIPRTAIEALAQAAIAALKPTEPTEFSSGISMSEEDTDPKRLGEATEPSEAKVERP